MSEQSNDYDDLRNIRPLWTARKGAHRCGMKLSTFYDRARRGEIGGIVHIGRRVMVNPDRLEEWIANGGQSFPGGWRKEPL